MPDQTHCSECGADDDGTQTFCSCGAALVDDHDIGCQWFALCDHAATSARSHPILGHVPICDRCSAKMDALA